MCEICLQSTYGTTKKKLSQNLLNHIPLVQFQAFSISSSAFINKLIYLIVDKYVDWVNLGCIAVVYQSNCQRMTVSMHGVWRAAFTTERHTVAASLITKHEIASQQQPANNMSNEENIAREIAHHQCVADWSHVICVEILSLNYYTYLTDTELTQ